ncbi:hypothetical protein KBP30_07505 [Streptomyces sp. Go40/10]|uniref:hypothetical protein n=1 Tax=Streptomyces sp. Go40/10 TaxID=2825844 RepID=UPI001E353B22|nr:hypothetical protein [Streptomyces sp. Go40/10]UFR01032.1 hypothetical protein KBP30_07505 [Streptomyces sp. Go40/10]
MPETSDPVTARWPLASPRTADWLRELAGDGVTGFMPPPLPDAVWVLGAMYEHDRLPADVTYDAYHRARAAEGGAGREVVGGIDLTGVGTATGGGLGRAEHPGPGWRRLRWAELAARTGDPLVPQGLLPSYRCFPSAKTDGSWPLRIMPPTEGSLDRETWNRLTGILTEHSPQGPDTRCLAYYNPLMLRDADFGHPHVRIGRLGDAAALYDNPEADFNPSNLWAEDRSWVLCTDYDLWATKVSGPAALVETLLHDAEIEAVRLPWAP